jgi:hypothetical protein
MQSMLRVAALVVDARCDKHLQLLEERWLWVTAVDAVQWPCDAPSMVAAGTRAWQNWQSRRARAVVEAVLRLCEHRWLRTGHDGEGSR